MRTGGKYRVVLVTCGSLPEARRMARSVVTKGFAGCVNITLSPVESIYAWKGKVEKAREHLLIFKTAVPRLAELEREVRRLHSYEVPEFIALPITEGSARYLSWLNECVTKLHE
jgi:periplasmic divalent cation tolerance protein